MSWKQSLTLKSLQSLSDSGSYRRGIEYYKSNTVGDLNVSAHSITANVMGTYPYEVELVLNENGNVDGVCDCPYGEDGNFCKHCVAVGLDWLQHGCETLQNMVVPKNVSAGTKGASDMPEIAHAEYLLSLNAEQLRAIILRHAQCNGDMAATLDLKMANAMPGGPDMDKYRQLIEHTIGITDYVEYDAASAYCMSLDNIVVALTELCDSGYASQARELVKYAIDELVVAWQSVDDSGGYVGMVYDDLHKLHLAASLVSSGDQIELAKQIYAFHTAYDIEPNVSVVEYFPALGDFGEAHFRNMIETKWAEVPVHLLGDERQNHSQRYDLKKIMVAMAKHDNDAARLINIYERDLYSETAYLEIAQVYVALGQSTNAIEWAEKARSLFPQTRGDTINDFLIKQYTHVGRYQDALVILWARFTDQTSVSAYKELHDYAVQRGEWKKWRDECWVYLAAHSGIGKSEIPEAKSIGSRRDASTEVNILCWEYRCEEAWDYAQAAGCGRSEWLLLAGLRTKDYPEESIIIYQNEVGRMMVNLTGHYDEPIDLMRKMREIMLHTDQEARFKLFVSALRKLYKRKSRFIKDLDYEKW